MLLPYMVQQELEVHKTNVLPQWKGLVVIGASMALNVSCMNASLQTLSLSLNQVIRSALPVLTSTLSFFVEGKRPTHYELAALSVLSVGVGVAVAGGTLAGSTRGILLCSVATLFQSLMLTFSGRVLSKKIDTFNLVFYQAPVALACLLPAALAMELLQFRQHLELQLYTVSLILGVTSVLALVREEQRGGERWRACRGPASTSPDPPPTPRARLPALTPNHDPARRPTTACMPGSSS